MSIAAVPSNTGSPAGNPGGDPSEPSVAHHLAEATARGRWGMNPDGSYTPSAALSSAWDPATARRVEGHAVRRQLACDIVSLITVTVGALAMSGLPWTGAVPHVGQGVLTGVVVVGLWLALLGLRGVYDPRRALRPAETARRAAEATVGVFAVLAIIGSVTGWQPGREFMLAAIPVGLGLMLATRGWAQRRRQRGDALASRVLVAGAESTISHVVDHLAEQGPHTGYVSAGSVVLARTEASGGRDATRDGETTRDGDVKQVENVFAIVDAATRSGADTVMVTHSEMLSPQAVQALSWKLAALDVRLVMAPCLTGVAASRLRCESLSGLPVVHVDYPRLHGGSAMAKRAFDVVFSLSVLAVLMPLFAVLALAVRTDSTGPALFRQERVGIDHSRFSMLKFRSMVTDAEALKINLSESSDGNDVLFKMRHDPRVTRVGRVLRRLSLDELPQFFNVLRGDMSVVGPRPPLPGEVDTYDERADRRLLVKPGITGLWQVQGRSDLDWENSLRLDLFYVENWSVWADLGIVLRTVRAVATGKGAY